MKKTVSIILALILIVSYALMAIASGESETDVKVNNGGDTANTTVAEETEANDGPVTVAVGDTLTANDVDITYSSCEIYTSYDSFFAPADGCVVIRLEFSVQNNGSSDAFISMYDFNCFADNEACDAWYYGDDNLSATVSSGRTASGAVYFEVPEDAEEIEVEYETDFWTESKAIFVVEV